VSQHLKVLKDARLVADQAVGTRRVYRLNPAGVAALKDQLDTFWRRALDGYQNVIEDKTEEGPRTAPASSWNTATSTGTAPAGNRSVTASATTRAGRCTSTATPPFSVRPPEAPILRRRRHR
jgi:DNA-binding PadR family transcriptional regulator